MPNSIYGFAVIPEVAEVLGSHYLESPVEKGKFAFLTGDPR